MPVLPHSQKFTRQYTITIGWPHLFIAICLVLSIILVIYRTRLVTLRDGSTEVRSYLPEKTQQETHYGSLRPSPLLPLYNTNVPLMPASMGHTELNMTSPTSANFSYYGARMTQEPMPILPTDFSEPGAILSSIDVVEALEQPRRRSYTRQTSQGGSMSKVSGEIVTGEGWRRHTRVFGGGVCEACEESERKMAA